MKWDSRVALSTEAQALLDAIEIGDVLDIINPLAWSNDPYLYFTDTTDITEGTLTDVQAVSVTEFLLTVDADQPIMEDTTLTLLDAHLGTAITWASNNTDVISDAGVVTVPADMKQVTVTLTATITKGTETGTATFDILVGDILSVENVIALDDDEEFRVQGVVIADAYFRTYFIQDATGGIAVYTSDTDLQAIFEANVGKEVIVTGARDTYNGLRQVAPSAVEALTTGTLPEATNVDAFAIDEVEMLPYQGMLVEFTNLYVTNVSVDGYGNISVTFFRPAADETISMRWDSRGGLTTEAETALNDVAIGDVLNVVTVMAWYNGPQLYYTSSTELTAGTLSDADKIAIDADALSVEAAFTEAATLTLPTTGEQGSSIAWTSSDAAIIDVTTGAVVLPAEGQVKVTLTATLTLGTEEKVVEFEVKVGVYQASGTELYISEYIEGSSSNKAIEIYNPTDAAIDLSSYSVVLYSNGSEEASQTYDMTGTLEAGEVFVIANSSAVQAILDVADVNFAYPSVPNWNGDDAVALLKDGVVIDVIGVIGVDPGSSWTVGTGSTANHTLVRVVSAPNATFTESEWAVYDEDTFTNLGSHQPA